MLFEIKKPCALCPFRRDVRPFLSRRAASIASELRNDHNWFACHETTGVKSGKRVRLENQSHCMGAAIVLWRSHLTNVPIRLALWLKLLDESVLNQPAPVFDSLEEFVTHHQGS